MAPRPTILTPWGRETEAIERACAVRLWPGWRRSRSSALGRFLVVQPDNVSLIGPPPAWPWSGWPAPGTAAGLDRHRPALALTVAVLALTDGDVMQSCSACCSRLQTLVAIYLLRRWTPHWGGGRARPIGGSATSAWSCWLMASGRWPTPCSAALGVALIPDESFDLLLGPGDHPRRRPGHHRRRRAALGGWLAEHHDQGGRRSAAPPRRPRPGARATPPRPSIFLFGFWLNPDTPTTFMLTLTVGVGAVRFNARGTAALPDHRRRSGSG